MQSPSNAGPRSLLLLAPAGQTWGGPFGRAEVNPHRHNHLLESMQRLRGRVYLADGAISESQLEDSRHILEIDEASWHLLIVDASGGLHGCARYCEYPDHTRFADLTVAKSALAHCQTQGHRLRRAVELEMKQARKLKLPYVELGGWALDESIRGTMEALRMTMATYALSQALGGAVGISTVTQRHASSSILRRVGGLSLEDEGEHLPPYYDPEYRCGMEVLRFYSWAPERKYQSKVNEMKRLLADTPVVYAASRTHRSAAWMQAVSPAVHSSLRPTL